MFKVERKSAAPPSQRSPVGEPGDSDILTLCSNVHRSRNVAKSEEGSHYNNSLHLHAHNPRLHTDSRHTTRRPHDIFLPIAFPRTRSSLSRQPFPQSLRPISLLPLLAHTREFPLRPFDYILLVVSVRNALLRRDRFHPLADVRQLGE